MGSKGCLYKGLPTASQTAEDRVSRQLLELRSTQGDLRDLESVRDSLIEGVENLSQQNEDANLAPGPMQDQVEHVKDLLLTA